MTAFVNRELGGVWTTGAGRDCGSRPYPSRRRNRAAWVLGEQLLVPRMAARAGCDLVHSMGSTAPLRGPFRRVTTVYDLIFRAVPETHFGLRAFGMRALVPAAARRSHRLIAPSSNTRDDLVWLYGSRPSASTSCPRRRVRPNAPRSIREVRRRHEWSKPAGAPQRLGQAGPTRISSGCSRHSCCSRARAAACARVTGLSDPHETRLRKRAARLGVRGRRSLSGVGGARGAGGPLRGGRRVRVPLAVRRVRAARARGAGPRRAGGILGSCVASRSRQ